MRELLVVSGWFLAQSAKIKAQSDFLSLCALRFDL